MHFSNDYGYGMVNAYNAVRMAEVWSLFQAAQTCANEHDLVELELGRRHRRYGIAIQTVTLQTFDVSATTPSASTRARRCRPST